MKMKKKKKEKDIKRRGGGISNNLSISNISMKD
jgi:hypothetical protein